MLTCEMVGFVDHLQGLALEIIKHMNKYRKQQKLCGRKLLRFIGFYHNAGKTFTDLLLISMKTTI